MKAIVTGGAGFIGSHVVDLLVKNGHNPIVIDNLSSTGDQKNISELIKQGKVKFYKEDITNREKIFEIFRQAKADIVFHLAAQVSVAISVREPEQDHKVNIEGSKNIIDASVKYGIKKIIYSGSGGSIYGDFYLEKYKDPLKQALPILEKNAPDETATRKPISPYAINKAKVIELLRMQDKVKWTALLYSNVYGPRQDPHGEAGVVAIFCQKMLDGQSPKIFGDGICIRDYVYCLDVARANVLAIDKGDFESINIGTNKGIDVNELYKLIKNEIGFNKKPIPAPFREGDVLVSIIKIEKAKKILGWTPQIMLDEGIKNTVDFFKANHKK